MEITSQEKLFCTIVKILSNLKIDYFITGGFAVSVWGRPRATFDIDIIVEIIEPEADLLVKAYKEVYRAGYANKNMVKEAIRNKTEFNFIDSNSGLKVDFWTLKEEPFELSKIRRRIKKDIFGRKIYFISPEDLILSKLLWRKQGGGSKHIEDAESILRISKKKIDMSYLKEWADKLNILDELNKLL